MEKKYIIKEDENISPQQAIGASNHDEQRSHLLDIDKVESMDQRLVYNYRSKSSNLYCYYKHHLSTVPSLVNNSCHVIQSHLQLFLDRDPIFSKVSLDSKSTIALDSCNSIKHKGTKQRLPIQSLETQRHANFYYKQEP